MTSRSAVAILFALSLPLSVGGCPKGTPQSMVLELEGEKIPIRSVLVLRNPPEKGEAVRADGVSVVFHADDVDCPGALPREPDLPHAATVLSVRGLNADFVRDETKPPLWSVQPGGGSERAFVFEPGRAKHALKLTRSGKSTAYGDVDLDVTEGAARQRMTGTFDAKICY